MTPTEIVTAARNKYNAVGNNFYSDSELYNLIYEAELILANEALLIESKPTPTTTVAGTQAYNYPTRAIAIKRLTYDGNKLAPISMREDDQLTFNNATTTEQGTPSYYFIFDDQVYLRPIPNDAKSLQFFIYKEPDVPTSTSTLETPTQFHMDIVNYVVSEMASKDLQYDAASFYLAKWEKAVLKAKEWRRRREIGDAFKVVKDEESLSTNILGPI